MTDAFTAGVKVASQRAEDKLRRDKMAVTSDERAELRRHYGARLECSLGRDKDGFYVYTHRARSKSYPRPSTIPKDRIRVIGSTG